MMGRLRRALPRFSPVFLAAALAAAALAFASTHAAVSKELPKKYAVVAPEEAVVEGGVFYVSVSSTDEIRGAHGLFQGKSIDFFPEHDPKTGLQRYTAIVGVAFGTPPGNVDMNFRVETKEGSLDKTVSVAVKSGVFSMETLSVPPRTITPSAKDRRQIERDQAVLRRVYAVSTQNKFWDPPVTLPVDRGITSAYGASRVYNGKKTSAHLGTDLRAPTGTPIKAPITGQVAMARKLFYTGYTVVLDHGYGMFSIYGHMSKLKVKEGQIAKKGEVVGLSGATGRASGPHLHWGVKLHGAMVDPLVLVQQLK